MKIHNIDVILINIDVVLSNIDAVLMNIVVILTLPLGLRSVSAYL